MWCCNSMHAVCDYASGATYRECPNIEQIRNGVIPLDSLPAAWWNWMWWDTNKAVNEARSAVGMFLNEMETVLCAAGVTANCTCVDNLYCAIEKIRTTVGTSLIAGAVKSSSCGGQVTIENDGTMTMNGVGNAAILTTTSKQVVGAINELKSTYDNCWTNNTTALSGKAPNAHASSETTYGVGNADCYGHLKISDTYSQVLTACAGVAASQKALACVYSAMTGAGYTTLGSTAGCALGTAAAGTANTAARSDHVHPKPSRLDLGLGSAADCDASCFRASTWTPTTVTNANKVCTTVATANSNRNLLLGEAAYTGTCCAGVYIGNSCKATFNPATGVLTAKCFCGCAQDSACLTGKAPSALCVACAGKDGSGCSFGTAARYACGCFLSATGCATDSAKLTGKAPSALCVACSGCLCYNCVRASIAYDCGYICINGFCNNSDTPVLTSFSGTTFQHGSVGLSGIKTRYPTWLCGECYYKPAMFGCAYFRVCFCIPSILYCAACNALCYIPAGQTLEVCGSCTCSCACLCQCWMDTYEHYLRFW